MPPQIVTIGVWYRHTHSGNTFTVTAIHAGYVDTQDADGERGFANLDLLEHDLAAGRYEIVKEA